MMTILHRKIQRSNRWPPWCGLRIVIHKTKQDALLGTTATSTPTSGDKRLIAETIKKPLITNYILFLLVYLLGLI
jgi:hypothetical protein